MKYFKTVNEFLFWGNDKIEAEKDAKELYKSITWMQNSEGVKNLQTSLEILGFHITRFYIDSIFGAETMGQIKSLLHLIKTNKDLSNLVKGDLEIKNNTVTPEQQSIIYQLAQNDKAKEIIKKHFEELSKQLENDSELIYQDLIVKNIENPEEFIAKLYEISKKLQIKANWLSYVIKKESSFSPTIVNKYSGASGLLQFIPSTARGLNTSVEEIRKMPALNQLDLIFKYFEKYTGKIHSVEDLYMITFYPIGLGKDDDDALGGKKVAQQNPGVDLNKDGQITVGEFKDYVKKDIPKNVA